jgi:hypothetical protein
MRAPGSTREDQPDRQPPLGIQLAELGPWIREHPVRGVITILLAAGAIGSILNPPIEATADRLTSGDCIYARTAAAAQTGPGARPIGTPAEVETVIDDGKAVRAACGLSHGHEVSATVPISPSNLDRAAIRDTVQQRCDAVFDAYVHHPLAGSTYVTFAVIPTAGQLATGSPQLGLCLVARADGQWLTTPARNSGE